MTVAKKILIVDDSVGWLNYHKENLTNFYGDEFVIETAASAREGYDMVYNNLNEPYKLIISDLQMELDFDPKLAGEWFIEQVRKLNQYRDTSIIIISATYRIKYIAENLEVDYIPKSIAAKDLETYKITIDKILKINS